MTCINDADRVSDHNHRTETTFNAKPVAYVNYFGQVTRRGYLPANIPLLEELGHTIQSTGEFLFTAIRLI